MTTRKRVVFLAHATEDKEAVRSLHKRLADAGVHPWLDEEELLPGQDWQAEIGNALARADFVIACISQNSISKNGFVQKELRTALTMQGSKPPGTIYLIPVILDKSEPPDLRIPELGLNLRNIQWLDINTDDAFSKLLRSIGFDGDRDGSRAPMVEVDYSWPGNWPLHKKCPKCDGSMMLNHDSQEYACDNCEHWEYGP